MRYYVWLLLAGISLPFSAHAACDIPEGTYNFLFSNGTESYFYNQNLTIRVDSLGNKIVEHGDFTVNVAGTGYQRHGNQFTFKDATGTYTSNNGGTIYFQPAAQMQQSVNLLPRGTAYQGAFGTYTKQADGQITFTPKLVAQPLVFMDCAPAQTVSTLGAKQIGETLVVSLQSEVLFDFDSAKLSPKAQAKLKEVATLIMQNRQGQVVVRGHTDSKGTDTYNDKLSLDRASATAAALEQATGLPDTTFVIQGLGERYPIAPNVTPAGTDNPAGRAQNRRVEILIETSPNARIPAPEAINKDFYGATVIQQQGDTQIIHDATGQNTIIQKGGSTVIHSPGGDIITNPDGSTIIKTPSGAILNR